MRANVPIGKNGFEPDMCSHSTLKCFIFGIDLYLQHCDATGDFFFFLLQEGRYLFESATMHLIYFDGLNRARTLLLHQVNRAVAIQYMRKHLMEAISCVLHVRKGNGGPVSPDIVWTS